MDRTGLPGRIDAVRTAGRGWYGPRARPGLGWLAEADRKDVDRYVGEDRFGKKRPAGWNWFDRARRAERA